MLGFYEENLYTERLMMGDTWLLTRDDLKDLKFVRDFVLLVYEIKKKSRRHQHHHDRIESKEPGKTL